MKFDEIYRTRPDQKDIGSSGYSRMKHLYDLAQKIKPDTIVESGTWKGNGSYLFYHAMPGSYITCFDISFDQLLWDHAWITYLKYDITKADWSDLYDNERTLIFFDDHIDQVRRLYWARETGIKHLVFDDNVPWDEARHLKNPPVPTLQMFFSLFPDGLPGWIAEYEILPWLGREARNTYLTYVKLK